MTQQNQNFIDDEMRRFIDDAPAHLTYSELAEACRRRFGSGRAWPAELIRFYWLATHDVRRGKPSKIELDQEVKTFIDDRLGRLTMEELLAACRERFGSDRTPSRTALYRYWQRLRQRAATAARLSRR